MRKAQRAAPLGLALLLAVACGSRAELGDASGAGGQASCPGTSTSPEPWPAPDVVRVVDAPAAFTGNLSGLTYEPKAGASPGVLWGVTNIPGRLYRLLEQAAGFSADTPNGWATGKRLRFPGGRGEPDAESVTFASSSSEGVYVASEHDNDLGELSRLSILRYDVNGAGAELDATHEWQLTALIPPVPANMGIEALTFVPDTLLVEQGFLDEATQRPYRPQLYPEHAGGVFFVGVEQTGQIFGFVLGHTDATVTKVAEIATPFSGVMGLELDRATGHLWFYCDDRCNNQAGILDIDRDPSSASFGRFQLQRRFERPASLPSSNNEGIAIGSAALCVDGFKPFWWADDNDLDGHSVRQGLLPCAACF